MLTKHKLQDIIYMNEGVVGTIVLQVNMLIEISGLH